MQPTNPSQRRLLAAWLLGALAQAQTPLAQAQAQAIYGGLQTPEPDEPEGDLLDQSPDTLRRLFTQAGRSLHARGSAPGRVMLAIHFGNGSAEVDQAIRNKLALPAAALLDAPHRQLRLRIEGHANATGPSALNRRLTLQRAGTVRASLQDHGVPGHRLEIEGLGFDQPLPGRHARDPVNRRVELWVIKS